jgi:hypothetical protein
LFVRRDVFERLGGLPVHTVLDDLPFGYRATVAAVSVHVVPELEHANAPESVRELIRQGRRWFHNYLDYPQCTHDATLLELGTSATRAIALSIGAYRGLTWLLRSPAAVAVVALALRPEPWRTRVTAGAALWFGYLAPVRALAEFDERPAAPADAVELLLASAVSSVGPFLAVAERLHGGPARSGISPKSVRLSGWKESR